MKTGIMEVTVMRARDLKNTEIFGRVDPYVVIQYNNQEQKSTTGQRKTTKSRLRCCVCMHGQGGRRPVWNEAFKFKVEYPGVGAENQNQNQQPKLILKIVDHDNFTNDDCLGQATIYLKELFELGLENGKAEIPSQKYRVVSADKTYQGEIQVGITFTADVNSEANQQEYNGGHKEVSRG